MRPLLLPPPRASPSPARRGKRGPRGPAKPRGQRLPANGSRRRKRSRSSATDNVASLGTRRQVAARHQPAANRSSRSRSRQATTHQSLPKQQRAAAMPHRARAAAIPRRQQQQPTAVAKPRRRLTRRRRQPQPAPRPLRRLRAAQTARGAAKAAPNGLAVPRGTKSTRLTGASSDVKPRQIPSAV